MKRRAASATSALRRALAQEPAQPAPSGLSSCVLCRADAVSPVAWEPLRDDRWWMSLRCGACGVSRDVVVADVIAERYDDELIAAGRAMAEAAQRLERERLEAEAEAFVTALQRDLFDAADFAR